MVADKHCRVRKTRDSTEIEIDALVKIRFCEYVRGDKIRSFNWDTDVVYECRVTLKNSVNDLCNFGI